MSDEIVYFKRQIHNPLRHSLMPELYPWEILLGPNFPPNLGPEWEQGTLNQIQDIKTSLNEEFSLYQNAVAVEEAQRKAFMDAVNSTVKRIQFGQELLVKFVTENKILYNITEEESMIMSAKLANISALISSGALETALNLWVNVEPDNILTQSRIDAYAQEIADFLGVEPPLKIAKNTLRTIIDGLFS